MKLLGLDVGGKRTGVAFADSDSDIVFSLETIHHSSPEELLEKVLDICQNRQIDEVVLGMPKLPSGEEGAQAGIVHDFVELLHNNDITTSLIDERYTSRNDRDIDKDAAAACAILNVKLAQL